MSQHRLLTRLGLSFKLNKSHCMSAAEQGQLYVQFTAKRVQTTMTAADTCGPTASDCTDAMT